MEKPLQLTECLLGARRLSDPESYLSFCYRELTWSHMDLAGSLPSCSHWLNPGTRWVLVKPSVHELWVSPPPPLLRHFRLLMSMPYFHLPLISVHSHRAGNNLGSCVFQAKDILCTKLWGVKMQSLFREQWNSGHQEQKMQVLKLSFFPLLSLSREEEAKCDQEATD